jgi:hypothetical protein
MSLILYPGTDYYTGITVSGLYDNNTESPLFAPSGTTVPTSGIAIGGKDANGLFQLLSQDQSANSLTFPGIQFFTGATWDTTTTSPTFQYNTGTATPLTTLSGSPAYLVQLDQSSGTFTGGAVTFQGTYDNVNWVTIPVSQLLNPNTFAQLTNPYTFVTATNASFLVLAQGYAAIRLDLSTAITGTGTVTPYWSTLAYAPQVSSMTAGTVQGNLTNDNAAPNAFNVGVLPALAATTYTTVSYTNGFQVLPVTDLHGASNTDMQAVAGVQLGSTAVTAFGSAPAAANVQGVNANIYTAGAAITTANALFTQISDGASAMGTMANFGTNPGAVKSLNTNSFVFNTNAAPIFVSGTLTNNNAAPVANNVGVLGYIATATPETYTQGDQVLATTSLGGAVRVVPVDEANASSLSYYEVTGGNTYIAVTTAFTPVMAFQSNSASFIYLLRMIQFFTGGQVMEFVMLKNPTVNGGAFVAASGHFNLNTTATSYTGGTKVLAGYVGSVPFLLSDMLDAVAAGAPGDTFAIEARTFSGTGSAVASARWSEQSAAL